jgi:hypothetical protein
MGHGVKIQLTYALRLFHLTAVMYVDDTNLFHWPESSTTEPDKLLACVQCDAADYGQLAQASGGVLKEKKCSVYFLDYKFVHGRAAMKSLQDLPAPWCYIAKGENMLPLHITIPQPVGPAVSIITHDVTSASKMLVIYFSPEGNSTTHVEHMVQKGLELVDCLHATLVSRIDVCLSFFLQLYPHILWGLVTTCMHPKKLDAQVQRIHTKALPFLGVNDNIEKEWRILPEQYQGLGMQNILLATLAEKLSFLVSNWGFHGQAHSDSLAMAYDNFLMQFGLYGSPLKWSYEEYGHLATYATWFQNLW